jgi:hypothetical protein
MVWLLIEKCKKLLCLSSTEVGDKEACSSTTEEAVGCLNGDSSQSVAFKVLPLLI